MQQRFVANLHKRGERLSSKLATGAPSSTERASCSACSYNNVPCADYQTRCDGRSRVYTKTTVCLERLLPLVHVTRLLPLHTHLLLLTFPRQVQHEFLLDVSLLPRVRTVHLVCHCTSPASSHHTTTARLDAINAQLARRSSFRLRLSLRTNEHEYRSSCTLYTRYGYFLIRTKNAPQAAVFPIVRTVTKLLCARARAGPSA